MKNTTNYCDCAECREILQREKQSSRKDLFILAFLIALFGLLLSFVFALRF
jgi:predicted nucleic acid-binding Zn ribbon protein